MKVEVVTPRDYMGDVIGDLNSRRGRITGQDQRGNARRHPQVLRIVAAAEVDRVHQQPGNQDVPQLGAGLRPRRPHQH